jgi:hypothetical protein
VSSTLLGVVGQSNERSRCGASSAGVWCSPSTLKHETGDSPRTSYTFEREVIQFLSVAAGAGDHHAFGHGWILPRVPCGILSRQFSAEQLASLDDKRIDHRHGLLAAGHAKTLTPPPLDAGASATLQTPSEQRFPAGVGVGSFLGRPTLHRVGPVGEVLVDFRLIVQHRVAAAATAFCSALFWARCRRRAWFGPGGLNAQCPTGRTRDNRSHAASEGWGPWFGSSGLNADARWPQRKTGRRRLVIGTSLPAQGESVSPRETLRTWGEQTQWWSAAFPWTHDNADGPTARRRCPWFGSGGLHAGAGVGRLEGVPGDRRWLRNV